MRSRDLASDPSGATQLPCPRGALQLLATLAATHAGAATGLEARLAAVARWLGEHAGLDADALDTVELLCYLRHVGALAEPAYAIEWTRAEPRIDSFEELERIPLLGAALARHGGFDASLVHALEARQERWDGRGYPHSLRAGEIPLVSRVLAVAECLVADPTLEALERGASTLYDPSLVRMALAGRRALDTLLAGAEKNAEPVVAELERASAEQHALYTLLTRLAASLDLNSALAAFDETMAPLAAYDAVALFVAEDDALRPAYVDGAAAGALSNMNARLDEAPFAGLDGVRAFQPSQLTAHGELRRFGAGLAVALDVEGTLEAALLLLTERRQAFPSDTRRLIAAVREPLARTVERTRRWERAQRDAMIDPVTGLPNARALFQRLDAELARCRRQHATLAVLQCRVRWSDLTLEPARAAWLPAVAATLRECFREEDYAATTGDGITIVAPGLAETDVETKCAQVRSRLAALALDASLEFGAAFCPQDGTYAEDLLSAVATRDETSEQARMSGELAELNDALLRHEPQTEPHSRRGPQ